MLKDCNYYSKDDEIYCIDDCDTLIFAVGYKSDTRLVDTLKELQMPYHTIGDANNVGTIKDAINAGYDIAKRL